MKKSISALLLSAALCVAMPSMAYASAKDDCDLYKQINLENKHLYPMNLGGDQRRLLNQIFYDERTQECTVIQHYEIPFELFVETVKQSQNNDDDGLARMFLEGDRGNEFISGLMQTGYAEELKKFDKPGINSRIRLSFPDNEREDVVFGP